MIQPTPIGWMVIGCAAFWSVVTMQIFERPTQERERVMPLTASTVLPGGIVLMDEPESVGITTTFAANGEVLMTFHARPGGPVGQVIFGLTPNMAVQLLEKLQKHNDACLRAIAEGKGGAKFMESQ